MKGRSILAALAACTALLAAPAQAYLYSGVYAFGDSLSDNGSSLTPDASTGRLSNGPVAVEYVATGLGVPLFDYAVSGATSGLLNTDSSYSTGVLGQVAAFAAALDPNGPGADSSALYIVSGGANDFLANPLVAPVDVITNLAAAVAQLYGLGARHFLLPLMPDLGMSPAAVSVSLGVATELTDLSTQFNAFLSGAYVDLFANYLPADATFVLFDTLASQHAAATHFNNIDSACPAAASNPAAPCDGYFFWDDLHPTTAVHALLGTDILAAIPEPGSLALTVAALAGLATRRRRRGALTAA